MFPFVLPLLSVFVTLVDASTNKTIIININDQQQDTTPSDSSNWLKVGGDHFIRIPKITSWEDARKICQSKGLDLYQPKDILAVAKYLGQNFSERYYWLAARGNGKNKVWLSGQVLEKSNLWDIESHAKDVRADQCVWLDVRNAGKGKVLGRADCTNSSNNNVLCGQSPFKKNN